MVYIECWRKFESIKYVVRAIIFQVHQQVWCRFKFMERVLGDGEEGINISLFKMIGALEFLITLVSKHVEMIMSKSQAH